MGAASKAALSFQSLNLFFLLLNIISSRVSSLVGFLISYVTKLLSVHLRNSRNTNGGLCGDFFGGGVCVCFVVYWFVGFFLFVLWCYCFSFFPKRGKEGGGKTVKCFVSFISRVQNFPWKNSSCHCCYRWYSKVSRVTLPRYHKVNQCEINDLIDAFWRIVKSKVLGNCF